jgi:hypothetical protein
MYYNFMVIRDFKKKSIFFHIDNFKKWESMTEYSFKFFDVKILWKTLISSSSVVWLMILILNNIILKYYLI